MKGDGKPRDPKVFSGPLPGEDGLVSRLAQEVMAELEGGTVGMREVKYFITFEVKDGHLDESLAAGWKPVFDEVEKCLTNGRLFEIEGLVTEYVQKLFPFVQRVRLDPTTS